MLDCTDTKPPEGSRKTTVGYCRKVFYFPDERSIMPDLRVLTAMTGTCVARAEARLRTAFGASGCQLQGSMTHVASSLSNDARMRLHFHTLLGPWPGQRRR